MISEAPVYSIPFSRKRLSCGPSPGDGVHIADRGVGSTHAAGALGGVADRRRVQLDKLVEAAAIERQFFHLPFIDQALRLQGGGIDDGRCIHDGDGFLHIADRKRKVKLNILANGEPDPGTIQRRKTIPRNRDGVHAHRDRGCGECSALAR